jgi:type IV secretion system protein VirB10
MRDQILDLFSADRTDVAPQTAPPLGPPSPPLAKRLNRNALTVAAVIMGMTVIVSLVVFNSSSRDAVQRNAASDPSVLEPTAPTFLERPVSATNSSIAGQTVAGQSAAAPVAGAQVLPGAGPPAPVDYSAAYSSPPPSYGGAAGSTPYGVGSTAAAPSSGREQAFDAALRRSAVASDAQDGSVGRAGGTGPSPSSSSLAADEARLVAYGDSLMRSAVGAPSPGASPVARSAATNPRRAFLADAGDLGGRSVVARMEPAGSPYALRAGTVIPATLLTAITSDLPGDCLGQVIRDVYDSRTQRTLLIPKGSKLICRYDDQVVAGQGRLLIAWTRLLLPDGRSMTLPGLPLKDPSGQTGAKGQVDNHTGRVFGRALLLSMIGAGAQLSQPRQSSILAAPTAGQVAAGAMGQELSNVALEIIRRGMDQPPTITVPQGQTFNVFLNGDLVFDGPYVPTP